MPQRDATDALLAIGEVPQVAGRSTARHVVDGGCAATRAFADTVSNTDDASPIRSSVQEARCAPL